MPVWMNLKCFMLRERIQTQEGIYYKVSSKWHPRRSKGIRTENGSVVANGNRWGWERLQRARDMIGGDRAMIACLHTFVRTGRILHEKWWSLCKWHLKKLQKKKRWCHSFVQNFPVCLTHSWQLPGRPCCSHRCCLFDIFFSWYSPADSSRASLTVLLAVPPNISLLLSQDLCTCCSSTRMFFPRYPQRSFSYFFLFFLILTVLGLHCYWVFSLVAGSRDCSRVVVCGLLTVVASFAEEFELWVCGLQ